MATEYPPLSKIHVVGYSANDKDYPILNQLLDPRVAGYKVPEDFSACPDKRYPNHIFTGAQPISGDQRVRHTWEILPSPWVPFTRYDDDLGPVQGRRRSVKNEGQQASLTSSTKISYEGREGSSLVLIESEETWSIKTDDDGNSLFPIKIRDFYDERFGAIQESRQLVVSTGDEIGSLTYSDPTIAQISYEPYNEYLLIKVLRTFNLPCPQRYEEVYDDARGAVQRTSQVIHDDKTLQASIAESNGIVTQTVYQSVNELLVDKIVETIATIGPLRFGGQTGQWGLESSSRQTVDAGTFPSYGFGVKASAVNSINSEHSEKQIENYPEDSDDDGIICTLIGQEQDEITKAVITVEKSLVEAATVGSGRVANYIYNLRNNNYVVEVQPVDKWHSITVASKITGSPNDESWTETGNINLPNELLEIGVIWDSDVTKEGGTSGVGSVTLIQENNINWTLRAESSITGKVIGTSYTKVRNGYNGQAQINVVRTFHQSAPTDPITIYKFEPVYGTLSIRSQSATNSAGSTSNGIGDIYIASSGGKRFNNDYGLSISQFGPIEHNGIQLTEQYVSISDKKTLVDSITSSSGSSPAGPYPVATASINISGSATLELPESSIPLSSGTTYIFNVSVKPWRLGWWIKETYTAVVP